jgi:hypothetical protein
MSAFFLVSLAIASETSLARISEYEYVVDLSVKYGVFHSKMLYFGRLDSHGQFVADPKNPPLPYSGIGSMPKRMPARLMQSLVPDEKLYQYNAARLVPGILKPDAATTSTYFYPDLGGKIIEFSEYLKDYDPKKSRRIYNLPGRIVKKGESKM